MVDTVDVQWIYPPLFDVEEGSDSEFQGYRRICVKLSGTSDGTGESDVVKVDISTLRAVNGASCNRTVIETIEWQIFGITCALEWDRAPHERIVTLNANGVESSGKMCWKNNGGLVDPGSEDGTGDIILTTTNADAGDTYEITIWARLKGD
jgi:hypothetical protein